MPKRIKNKKASRQRHYIREWRLFRKMTQEQLADLMETTSATISRIETRDVAYTQDTLEFIASVLQTDCASLLIRDPKSSETVWELWAKAEPAQRRQIVEIVKTLLTGQ